MVIEYKDIDYLVVGCGFWGATFANKIANYLNKKVLIIDSRTHIGGNCYSEIDKDSNIEYHKYGSHIFHTNHKAVWDFLNQYGHFNTYRHKVITNCKGKYYIMPINLLTINDFFRKNLKPFEAEEFIEEEIKKANILAPKNLEEKAISQIGEKLYNAFIKGYTEKQWICSAKDLPESIIKRLPVRRNFLMSYFENTYEGIPLEGWTNMFKKILESPNITIKLGLDFFDIKNELKRDCKIIYTGNIDRLYNYKYGKLEWISLDFEYKKYNCKDWQGTSVLNYSDKEIRQTRTHEFKHLHPERKEEYEKNETLICYEYPKRAQNNDEKFYPIPTEKNILLYQKYAEECKKNSNLIIGGRLGLYKYMNMDETIKSSLDVFEETVKKGIL